jgi:hypothetical protein
MVDKMDEGFEKEKLRKLKPKEHIHYGIKGYLGTSYYQE